MTTKSKRKAKCYWFSDDERGEFRFVRSDRELRKLEEELGEATRYEQFDQYGYAIPAQVLLDAKFWFSCHGCGTELDAGGPRSREDDDDECPPLTEGVHLWCNGACRHMWRARLDRIKGVRERIADRWPFVDNVSVSNGGFMFCECFNRDRDNVIATFDCMGVYCQHCDGCKGTVASPQFHLMAANQRVIDKNGKPVPQGAD